MGGKTETYSDFMASRVFKDDSKLLSKEFIRQFANYKTIAPNLYMNNIVNSLSRYFNIEVFKQYGIDGRVVLEGDVVEYDDIVKYLDIQYTGENKVPFFFGSSDINGNAIDVTAIQVKDYFDANYYQDTSFERVFNISYQATALDEGDCNGKTAKEVHIMLNGSETVDVSYDVLTYMYSKDNRYYAIKDPIQIVYDTVNQTATILMEEYTLEQDGTYTYLQDTYVDYIEDNRVVYIVKYAFGSMCDNTMSQTVVSFFKKDVEHHTMYTDCMLFPIKDDGNFVSLEEYQKILLNDFGFDYDDIKSSLSQDELKSAVLTYSTAYNNSIYKDYIEDLYGTPGRMNYVTVRSDYYEWYYMQSASVVEGEIIFEGYSKFVDGDENLFIMPINIINSMTLEEKYQFIEQCMSIYGYSSEEVELEWYQTGFFKLITLAITFAFAIATGQVWVIGLSLGSMIIGPELVDRLGPEAAAALGILITVLTADFSAMTFLDTAAFSLALGERFFSYWNIGQMQDLSNKLESYKDETERINEELSEMTSDFVYNPFNGYNAYYNNVYNNQFSAYSSIAFEPATQLANQTFRGVF